MERPFFTVIIPTYNRAELIRRPIDSVIAQTFQSWELIVVDDGSTDNTEQVLRSYTDNRIRYIHQPNMERSAARNTGMANSKGQYICFLDSDDYYLPEHLDSFHKKIIAENIPVAVLYCDTIEDANGKLTKFVSPQVQARNNVEWVVQMTLGVPRACTHRSILEKHKFDPSITVGEDVDLWVRVLKEFPVIHNDAYTVAFVSHEGRTVNIRNEKSFKAHVALIEKIISEDTQGFILEQVRKKILANSWFRLAQHYDYSGQRWKAFKSYFRSLKIDSSERAKEKIYLMMNQFFITKGMLSLLRRYS